MKFRIGWMALTAVLALGLVSGPAAAGDEDDDGGDDLVASMAASVKRMTAMVEGMVKFTDSTRLSDESVKSLLKHGKSFTAAGETKDGEDQMEQALEAGFKKTGKYDFAPLFELAPLKDWAKKAGVEPKAFARSFLRFQALTMREEFLKQAAEMRKNTPEQLAELEKGRAMMGEAAYAQAKKAVEAQLEMAKAMDAAAKSVPEVTAEEKDLLAKHGTALKRALGMDDDDEGDEEEDEGKEGEEKEGHSDKDDDKDDDK